MKLSWTWITSIVLTLGVHSALGIVPLVMNSAESERTEVIKIRLQTNEIVEPEPELPFEEPIVEEPPPKPAETQPPPPAQERPRPKAEPEPEPVIEAAVEPATIQPKTIEPEPPAVEPPPMVTEPPPTPQPRVSRADWMAYGQGIHNAVMREQSYPLIARRMEWTGVVVLQLRIGPDGQLVAPPGVVESSGHQALDEEALRMVRVAARSFSALPEGFDGEERAFQIPVRFTLR